MDAFPFKLVFDQPPFPADAAAGSSLSASQTSGGRRRQRKRGSGVKLSTDPQSVAARERRHRISHRFKILQSLVPGGSKMDTVSMLEEAIHYVKFLQTQISLHNSVMAAAAASSEEYPTAAAAPFFAAATSVAAPAPPASNSPQLINPAHCCYETHAASAIGNSSGSSALLPQPDFGYPTAPFPQLQYQAAAYPPCVEEEDDQLFSGIWVPGNC